MKQLNKLQTLIFLTGGAMMVVGAGCFALMWQQKIACWIYLAGALMFGVMQMMQEYQGNNFIVKRLKRIMSLADIFFILSGFLMVDMVYRFLQSAFNNYLPYYNTIYNQWVVLLLIAAILEMYTMHRIEHELSKEE